MTYPSTWPDAKVTRLKELWAAGLSGSMIGDELGKSRNAVIGKVHRLGLSGRKTVARKISPPRQYQPRKPPVHRTGGFVILTGRNPMDPTPLPAPTLEDAPPERRIKLLDLSDNPETPHNCRYWIGEVTSPDGGFCPEPTANGTSWCSTHLARVSAPPRK